jgi:hypothetical protein
MASRRATISHEPAALLATTIKTIPTDAAAAAALQREFEADAPALLSVEVSDAEGYQFADALLRDVVARKDAALSMRGSVTGPLYSVIRTVEAWFKPMLDAVAPVEKHLRGTMGAYRVRLAELEREAREAAAVAAETGDAEALIEALEVASDAAAPVVATSTTAFYWTVERVVEGMLPDQYWIVDHASLNAIAKSAGSSDEAPIVPGVIFKRMARIGVKHG